MEQDRDELRWPPSWICDFQCRLSGYRPTWLQWHHRPQTHGGLAVEISFICWYICTPVKIPRKYFRPDRHTIGLLHISGRHITLFPCRYIVIIVLDTNLQSFRTNRRTRRRAWRSATSAPSDTPSCWVHTRSGTSGRRWHTRTPRTPVPDTESTRTGSARYGTPRPGPGTGRRRTCLYICTRYMLKYTRTISNQCTWMEVWNPRCRQTNRK